MVTEPLVADMFEPTVRAPVKEPEVAARVAQLREPESTQLVAERV